MFRRNAAVQWSSTGSMQALNLRRRSRYASSSSSSTSSSSLPPRFPFPKHSRPTPHEIFHLPQGASQRDIKARYYDLVRTYHPDSPHCRSLPRNVCHARFQAITAAHDALTGKTRLGRHWSNRSHSSSSGSPPTSDYARQRHRDDDPADQAFDEFMARHRTHWNRASGAHHGFGNAEWASYADSAEAGADDRWKDRVIMAVMIGTLAVAVSPFISLIPYSSYTSSITDSKHLSAAQNLAQARREAREYGLERRREIRKRVRVNQLESEFDSSEGRDASEIETGK
ncbi:hypothetical protein SCHPADRAFT_687688 [Schizopora paradoxa]|uniref:J domain-containing protein n=1 Tax=Schizopora paradoxa TaxID=27342 RepID=A0A0H2RP03_9AGAM|nr:hypothetical protein SCHPADRAFT_687688 [Schizopora paradoxa]